ncbi:serine protease persephone-like [Sabethes cyaneus]|uniref:serine protease persephone-like n=1 Tax=Sabethes cyaneus TaxID=53552 RepID=UPI00237E69D7|nr:serine protease persephone-like [Sabethes cyaneus]
MLQNQSFVTLFTVICGLVLLSFTSIGVNALYENDYCQLAGGSAGICTINSECPWFVSNVILKKLVPYSVQMRCGFVGDVEIICCPKVQPPQNLLQNARADNSEYGQKAIQACRDIRGPTKQVHHIIEGEDAEEGDVPFIAALGYVPTGETVGRYDWGCGSSLISVQFLLTAAHCIRPSRRPVVARMGTLNLDMSEYPDAIQDSPLKNFFPHPKYRGNKKYHDIALIEVTNPFVYNNFINPVCLHTATDDLPVTQTLIASGWGETEDEVRSDKLLKVNLTTEPLEQCDKEYRRQFGTMLGLFPEGITQMQYCAIGALVNSTGERGDTCRGDSGGPLHYADEERFYLVGITSFAMGCGGQAAVYTRVAAYLDWIESIVWPDSAPINE